MTYRTADQVASEFITEGQQRNIAERGIVICIATGLVESNLTVYANAKVDGSIALPHDAVGSDGMSVGPLQQQVIMGNGWWWGPVNVCQDPTGSAGLFYDRLVKQDYQAATTDTAAGAIAQSIQGSEYPDRYATRMADAQAIYDRLAGGAQPVTAPRPDFNEYPLWSPNNESRNGTAIDLWLWHTEQGHYNDPNAADDLARGDLDLASSQVSYHYTGSQAPDGGVTICDVVDTDMASWSVLSANDRSIDFCIAGSDVAWTRDQWMANSKVLDVGCYLSVLDHVKYKTLLFNGAPRVIAPDPSNTNLYHLDPPGISDHKYVTQYLHDGTHSDVGPNFPWDYITERTAYWWSALTSTAPVVTTPVAPPSATPTTPATFVYPTDHDMLVQIWEQHFGYQGRGYPALFGMTDDGSRGKYLDEAVSDILHGKTIVVPAAIRLAAKMLTPSNDPRST